MVFVKALVIQQVQDPFDLFPQREQSSSTGSGFLISSNGLILTNYHVIEGADRGTGVTVQFEDNVTRHASVVGEDPNNDLALLRVDMSGVPAVTPLPLGDSTTVRVGDPTLAIGNPFGLDRTLTSGIVSALQRQIQAPNGFSIDNMIQTDAPINPGKAIAVRVRRRTQTPTLRVLLGSRPAQAPGLALLLGRRHAGPRRAGPTGAPARPARCWARKTAHRVGERAV